MEDLNLELSMFTLLKEELTHKYRLAYPEYRGRINDLKGAGILNFQVLLEEEAQGRISEKWFYTHLKPEVNTTLPRQDALDMLCKWLGYRSWDEFVFKNSNSRKQIEPSAVDLNQPVTVGKEKTIKKPINTSLLSYGLTALILIVGFVFLIWQINVSFFVEPKPKIELKLYDALTHEPITEATNIEILHSNKNNESIAFEAKQTLLITCEETQTIVLNVPYFNVDTIQVACKQDSIATIYLTPDYYSRMLISVKNKQKGESAIIRKKLNEMLNESGEFIQVENGTVEVEIFNKEEFIQFLLSPAGPMGKMKILVCEYEGLRIKKVIFNIQSK